MQRLILSCVLIASMLVAGCHPKQTAQPSPATPETPCSSNQTWPGYYYRKSAPYPTGAARSQAPSC